MSLALVSEKLQSTPPGQIELRIARSQEELEHAFRLVHHSYVRAGLASPNAHGMRLTKFHLLPTTQVMLAKKAGSPIATASLVLDREGGLPADEIYRQEIDQLRCRGLRLGEVGSLADCRESVTRFIHMFRRLTTLIAQVGEAQGCNALIATTHPKHARFYIRQLGFEQFGDPRECPHVQGKPAVALLLDFEKQQGTPVHEHLFGQKYAAADLAPYHWEAETRKYFSAVLEQIQQPAEPLRTLPSVNALPTATSWAATLTSTPVRG
ncbi:N-acyl amino acid synthase FeeM domain-containing protein [Candidatus Laterigemmans baculatus]|uniref:N-acyl amino acid synthase FeeM domain-containing protein n=1 Tax=Candidatus Laterigemmans baculatus TaxID=2770505 RepID=UPI0013DAF7E6|nr:long-chain N-acyl amino acid synthase [Candidatus Laterigemmans baculatus]